MAVVNYYLYPVGGTTPPTVVQSQGVQAVYAQLLMGDTDTAAIVTHNFGVVQPNVLSYSGAVAGAIVAATSLFPVVNVTIDASSAGTGAGGITALSYSNINSVAVGVKKPSQVGSNATYNFEILRPFSPAFS